MEEAHRAMGKPRVRRQNMGYLTGWGKPPGSAMSALGLPWFLPSLSHPLLYLTTRTFV